MDLHQLKTFVVVARERSITRASELLHLSQPAVSAHIKSIEDALELTLFERTSRGMILTADGQRLLSKAEHTLGAHRELIAEATRIKGHLSGTLRVGAGSNTNHEAVGRLLTALAERHPELQVTLAHGTSSEIVAGIRKGTLDAGFYNEPAEPEGDLSFVQVSSFTTHVVGPAGLARQRGAVDWAALSEQRWIYPVASACCAVALFEAHAFRPKQVLGVDRERVTRTLVAGGLGVGLLHHDTAMEARARGEVDVLFECPGAVRVLFASLSTRRDDPFVAAASAILSGAQ